jgi:Arc/MetJ-type ribon-helix-helix transcriptional regulator
MKLSVSVSEHDVAVVDAYARAAGLPSRSAAIQHAIRLLSQVDLENDYAQAWQDWENSGEQEAWEATAGDGLTDATR